MRKKPEPFCIYQTMPIYLTGRKHAYCHHDEVWYYDKIVEHQSIGCNEPLCMLYWKKSIDNEIFQQEQMEQWEH